MSEHAFDPMPDEQQEPEASTPLAIVSRRQMAAAIKSGRWEHERDALWLNTAFPPRGRETAELTADLEAHGILVT